MSTQKPFSTPRALLLMSATALLAGCGAAHPCIHGKGGVCVGPREVWGITRHRDQVKPDKNTIKDQALARKLLRAAPSKQDELPDLHPQKNPSAEQSTQGSPTDGQDPSPSTGTGSASLLAPLHYPKPLISQPKVLRVWVAPYRGPGGNLHFPGMVYSIITPQSWTLGNGSAKAPVPVPVS